MLLHMSDAPTQRKTGLGKRLAMIGGAAVLFVGGIGVGAAASNPTDSEEYVALASEKSTVESDYENLQGEHQDLQANYDEMSSGIEDREADVEQREADVKEAEEEVKSAEGAVKKREEAVSGAEKKKADNTVTEGIWIVGDDIAPGTYRTTDTVGSRCYWALLTTGTNGDDIVSNGIPGGGRPSVTVAEGQDFETSNCGTWELQ
jgi:hypothetical protein